MINNLNSLHMNRRTMKTYLIDEMVSSYAFTDWMFRGGEVALAIIQLIFIIITACIVKKLITICNGIYNSLTNLNEIDLKERAKQLSQFSSVLSTFS